MVIKNICTKRTFTTKNGEEKATWPIVGVLKETDKGQQFISLNMFPQTDFYVFEQREKVKKVDLGDGVTMEESPF
jgi:hypothetical protein